MLLANIGITLGIISLAISSLFLIGSLADSIPTTWSYHKFLWISWLSMFIACVGIFLNLYAMRTARSIRPIVGVVLTSVAFVCALIFFPIASS